MFNVIGTHRRADLDAAMAIGLIKKFGEERFPGVSQAKIVFDGVGGEDLSGFTAEEWEGEGVILIDVGGGRFDHHPGPNKPGIPDECASTLVAKELGIENDPALINILRFVKNADLKAGNHPFDLANLVKVMHHANPEDPSKVVNWTLEVLDAIYIGQVNFLAVAGQVQSEAVMEEIQGPGRNIKLASGESDSEKFSAACRKQGAAIVIQRRPSGNVQIYTANKEGLRVYDIVQMLRVEEREAKGNIATTDWKVLAREGKVEGAEEWYFQEAGQMILNGSLTCPNTPTHLSLERIRELVVIGMNPRCFEPSREKKCKQGVCTSTRDNPCPWYNWGLNRCRKVRHMAQHCQ